MTSIDPLAFARDLLVSLAPDTAIAAWPICADRLEDADGEPVAPTAAAGVLLLQEAGGFRSTGLPAWNPFRLQVRSYGIQNDVETAALGLRTVSDLIHRRGPVSLPSGRLWKARDELGPQQPTVDPSTSWTVAFGVFDLVLADQ